MGNTVTESGPSRDYGAAEVQRVAQDAPRWPEMNLAMVGGTLSDPSHDGGDRISNDW